MCAGVKAGTKQQVGWEVRRDGLWDPQEMRARDEGKLKQRYSVSELGRRMGIWSWEIEREEKVCGWLT